MLDLAGQIAIILLPVALLFFALGYWSRGFLKKAAPASAEVSDLRQELRSQEEELLLSRESTGESATMSAEPEAGAPSIEDEMTEPVEEEAPAEELEEPEEVIEEEPVVEVIEEEAAPQEVVEEVSEEADIESAPVSLEPAAPVEKASAEESAPVEAPREVGAGDEFPDDELTRIRGVGAATARQLKKLGIKSFAQIAAWTDEEIAETPFRDRVIKNKWREQAAKLAE